jgi:hypothetical protein
MTGTDIPDKWVGTRVRVFNDPTVTFGGQQVGGIRFARVRQPSPAPAKPVFQSPPANGDETRQAQRETEAEQVHEQQRIRQLEQELEALKQKTFPKKASAADTGTDENGVPY